MSETTTLSAIEEQAFHLSRAAILLDQAKADRSKMTEALEVNMAVWVALRTLITSDGCRASSQVVENLLRLANFVAEKTLAGAEAASDATIDALINVNLQISEGLLEGNKA
ncbi:MAG: flagellar biosynthesis regulator FlaF [Magnetospirillum sp.]